MTDWTNKRMGGSPLEGVDEVAWLKASSQTLGEALHLAPRACPAPSMSPSPRPACARTPSCARTPFLLTNAPQPHPALPPPQMFLERRKWILENTDREWAESVQRVLIYQWVLEASRGGFVKESL